MPIFYATVKYKLPLYAHLHWVKQCLSIYVVFYCLAPGQIQAEFEVAGTASHQSENHQCNQSAILDTAFVYRLQVHREIAQFT